MALYTVPCFFCILWGALTLARSIRIENSNRSTLLCLPADMLVYHCCSLFNLWRCYYAHLFVIGSFVCVPAQRSGLKLTLTLPETWGASVA